MFLLQHVQLGLGKVAQTQAVDWEVEGGGV